MSNQTKIKFYSGLDTVGGVVMELSYGDHRILMEMGSAFNPQFDLYDGFVNTRKSYLTDSIWTNDVPEINGLFDKKELEGTDILPADRNKKTAVLLTHLHLDHMRNMGLVSDDVDVYLCKNAQIIEQALEDVGDGIVSKRTHYNDIPEELVFGDIRVKPFILNDDSYKDYSFYIETPDLKLHYTGDIFIYGVYEEKIKKEIEFLKAKDIDVLVCEGTSFLPSWLSNLKNPCLQPQLHLEDVISEKEMIDNAVKKVKNYPSLVVFNIYPREICHSKNWLEIAERTGRTIVFEPKTAHILNCFLNSSFNVVIPDTYDESSYPDYLKDVMQKNNIIAKEEILKNPEKYLLQNSYENILELFDYRHINALYMHHSGTPLGAYDPAFNRMMLIVEKSNMTYQHIEYGENGKFYSHAVAPQLLWYINEVNPKLLVPSHCPQRELEGKAADRPYYLCQKNVTYIYDKENNTLKEVE